jgi:multiple sugar transport system ATP-binding protein
MSLGLRLRNLPRGVIDARVRTAAESLGISGVLDKRINVISEADKQKVALGRAIVCNPKVLLVDEDFARQNEQRRREMISDIKKINKDRGITVLYVTNDYDEAVTLAHKVIFMKDGEITKIKESCKGV